MPQQKVVDQVMEGFAGLLREYAAGSSMSESTQNKLLSIVHEMLAISLARTLRGNELHRLINTSMRQGLHSIYKTISALADAGDETARDAKGGGKLFCDATEQINAVMEATLEAAESIMTQTEFLQNHLAKTAEYIQEVKNNCGLPEADAILQKVKECHGPLSIIVTDLSFQDLTGQRLKKVVSVLEQIQETVFDMYVASGLMLKAYEQTPEKEIGEIAVESKRRLDRIREAKSSDLKGPSKDAHTQADVDSLLADLGL